MIVAAEKKVSSILISQPQPDNRSPYFDISERFNVRIDFNPFIMVEGVTAKEFRKSRVNINDYPAVIFTSRNSMDHFFRIGEELRYTISQETKYFCVSEAIALYLQKHIQYRKRKVFFGNGSIQDMQQLLLKHRSTGKFLYPCSDVRKTVIPSFLEENQFDYTEAVLYRTVPTDITQLNIEGYDMLVFFSPSGVKSLFRNFPDYKQGNTRIAAFGPSTCDAVKAEGLTLNIEAPVPGARSMSMAIEHYLQELHS